MTSLVALTLFAIAAYVALLAWVIREPRESDHERRLRRVLRRHVRRR